MLTCYDSIPFKRTTTTFTLFKRAVSVAYVCVLLLLFFNPFGLKRTDGDVVKTDHTIFNKTGARPDWFLSLFLFKKQKRRYNFIL